MHTIISENTIVNAAPNAPARATANTISPIMIALTIKNRNIFGILSLVFRFRPIKDLEKVAKGYESS